ncbi:MAG: UDP-3-O-acyl-N-acetylglucosamine deacetylase [Thermoanaerobaculia bacterium]
MRAQQTLRTPVSIEGIGLHSGQPVRATFRPARSNHGIVFVRDDRPAVSIPAFASSALAFDHATTIGRDDVLIGTVEHALSAAYGLGIDNMEIEVRGSELPILDGSALPFVRLFQAAGLERQDRKIEPLAPSESLEISDGDKFLSIRPGRGLTITYEIDFPHRAIGRQTLTFECQPEAYASKIAPARTFGFTHEIAYLRERGLARGGSLQNAVVLDPENILSGPLRFVDEFVRHKILDLVGDLALLGRPLEGRVHARKAGHALHSELVRRLAAGEASRAIPARAGSRQVKPSLAG